MNVPEQNNDGNDECAKTPTLKEEEEEIICSSRHSEAVTDFCFSCNCSIVGIDNDNCCTKIMVEKLLALLKERENELETKIEAEKIMEKKLESKINVEAKLMKDMAKLEEENKILKQENGILKTSFRKCLPSMKTNFYLSYKSDQYLYASCDLKLKIGFGSPNMSSLFKFWGNSDGTFGIFSTIKEKFLSIDRNSAGTFTGTSAECENCKFEIIRQKEIKIDSAANKFYLLVQIRSLANDQFLYAFDYTIHFSTSSTTFFVVFADE